MNSNLHVRAQLLQDAIRRALLEEWDPIGIATITNAQDEYDSYVLPIYDMLVSPHPQNEVFRYLWWLETEQMGLTGNRQATERFTDRLLRLPNEIDGQLDPRSERR